MLSKERETFLCPFPVYQFANLIVVFFNLIVHRSLLPGMILINWSPKNTWNYLIFKVIHSIVHWESSLNNLQLSVKHKIVNVFYIFLLQDISIVIQRHLLLLVSTNFLFLLVWTPGKENLFHLRCLSYVNLCNNVAQYRSSWSGKKFLRRKGKLVILTNLVSHLLENLQ